MSSVKVPATLNHVSLYVLRNVHSALFNQLVWMLSDVFRRHHVQ